MSSYLLVFGAVSGAALFCYTALLLLSLRKGLRSPAERYFALYLSSMMVWSLGALMMYADPVNGLSWNRFMMMGVAAMPFAFYGFVQGFRGSHTRDPAIVLGFAAVVAMLGLAAMGYLVSDIDVTKSGMIEYRFGSAMPAFGVYYLLYQGLAGSLLLHDLAHRQEFVVRNRTKYILLGLVVILLGGATNIFPVSGAVPLDITANLINALIITYTISRYQLLDLTLIVRKTMVYSLSTALVAIGYLVIVFLGVDLLHLVGGMRLVLALLVAGAVAVALHPVRDRAQAWVDKLFFRDTYDAGLMLQRLSQQVAAVLEPTRLAQLIQDELRDTMQASVALLIRNPETGEFAALGTVGQPPDAGRVMTLQTLRLPSDNPIAVWLASHDDVLAVHELNVQPQFMSLWAQERADLQAAGIQFFIRLPAGHELVGILALGPRRSEASYTPDELRTLQTLANQAAVAVQNAWLYGDAIAEKERAQTILQAAFAGIVVVDQQLQVVTMNPSAEEITGHRLATLRDRSLTELLGPDLVARNLSLAGERRSLGVETSSLGDALSARLPLAPTEVSLDGGDRSRDVLLAMTPLRGGFLLNFADITRLKEVDRLKSEIVANVSHELRGPLASIKGYTELLLEEMDAEDRGLRKRFLSVIDEETDRLASLINDMLDLARLESGHVQLALAPTSVDVLLAEVVRSLELQARAAEVTVQVNVPRGLSPVAMDRALMHSALKNLVSNAIKFSPCGTAVEVAARISGPTVIVDVVDQGPGIPAEDLPLLFTKFYRGRVARESRIAGTGLGLALVRQTIERHRGSVTVENMPGCGARFTVTLPVNRADQEES